MPTLNESIVEDATLTRFEELGYTIGHVPHMAHGDATQFCTPTPAI